MEQIDIRVMIGSLRAASWNRKVFESSLALIPETMRLSEIKIGALPLYNEDVQNAPPPEVEEFWSAVREADGILFISPEYNHSIPGVLKNAIDWGSRPPGSAPIYGKPAGILGASNGRSGTMRMQMHLLQLLPALNMPILMKPEVYIMSAQDSFDDDGVLTNDRLRKQLTGFYLALETWVRRMKDQD